MPIYMQYDGIDGDVTTKGHEKWIELQSCSLGANRSMTSSSSSAADRESSTPSVSEIVVTKVTDAASTNLFRAAVGKGPGSEGKLVKIDFCKTDAGDTEPYLQLELENTLVSSFSVSSGGDRPMESLSLNFVKVTLNNIGMGAANETGQPDRAHYDLSTHEGA